MKKLFTLFLVLVASIGTMFAWDYERVQIGDLYYNLDATNQTAEVTSQNSSYPYWSTTITTAIIPASVEYNSVTYSVTYIGMSAFESCSGLISIEIPNSVTSIGMGAFEGCGLTSVTIPNSVTSIGDMAFELCSNLTSVTIPNSVTSIGMSAFVGCSGLTSVTIPNSVTSIGSDAFRGCSGLTSVTIPNSVTSIGSDAFQGCGLNSIEIPNSVTSIGDRAFESCNALTSIIVENGNSFYDSRNNCNALIETATYTLIVGCKNTIIPNSVTSIGMSAFAYCGLNSIEIPNSVTSIGSSAFESCNALTSVTIPNSVTSIGEWAFSGCKGLTSVTISNSVISIGGQAFYGCTALTSVTIPNSVTSIGESAFAGCSGLTSVTIPNSVTSIGYHAFYGNSGLTSITCEATTPPTLGGGVFSYVDKSIPLYVPAQSVDLYKAADRWKEFTNILPIPGVEPEKFSITWQDEDGNPIKVDEIAYGEIPVFSGATPTKEATAEYTYEFAGWLPKVKETTKDICYTTYFKEIKIEPTVYNVHINGENCSLHISNELPAGTTLQVEAVADECFEFRKWSDNNTDNPRTITVTEDSDLTAEFNKVTYTITGENENEGGEVQIIP